jgi:hypothetical protein
MKYDQIEIFSNEQFRRLTGVKRSLLIWCSSPQSRKERRASGELNLLVCNLQ